MDMEVKCMYVNVLYDFGKCVCQWSTDFFYICLQTSGCML